MKSKKLFLMAAMLLMSVCGFAQGNSTLKGDVNGDNKVDVADIITIVEIIKNGEGTESDGKLYYYVGPEQPSKENYKTIGTEVTEYPNQFEYTSEDRQYLYGLVASGKTLQFIDSGLGAPIDTEEQTDINIPGYKVFKSAVKISGTVIVKISDCDYYLGLATEEQVQDQSYINSLTHYCPVKVD